MVNTMMLHSFLSFPLRASSLFYSFHLFLFKVRSLCSSASFLSFHSLSDVIKVSVTQAEGKEGEEEERFCKRKEKKKGKREWQTGNISDC